jgi:hypothetical protein
MPKRKPKTSLEERTASIMQWLKANPRLVQVAEETRCGEPLEDMCHRFATCDSTATKAFKKMLTHLEYRAKHKVNSLALLPARQVFKHAEAQMAYNQMMPHGLLGHDKDGSPVLYKHCGNVSVSELARRGADMATTLRYNEWVTERLLHAMGHRGQWTFIVYLKGLSISQIASMKWMLWTQAMASHDALHYPDRMNRVRASPSPCAFFPFMRAHSYPPSCIARALNTPDCWFPT